MIDHVEISVSDIGRSKEFYLPTLSVLGYVLFLDKPETVSFGVRKERADGGDPGGAFWLSQSGVVVKNRHLAFSASSHAQVRLFFSAGKRAGGTDNGRPGFRPQYHSSYYAAYLLDPDGYNIEAVCHQG